MKKKLNRHDINNILKDIESKIQLLTKDVPIDYRDEVRQDIRIGIWKAILKKRFDDLASATKYAEHRISLMKLKSLSNIAKQNKDRRRVLDSAYVFYSIYYPNDATDFSFNIEHVLDKLQGKERQAIEYIAGIDFAYTDKSAKKFGFKSRSGFYRYVQRILAKVKNILNEGRCV